MNLLLKNANQQVLDLTLIRMSVFNLFGALIKVWKWSKNQEISILKQSKAEPDFDQILKN